MSKVRSLSIQRLYLMLTLLVGGLITMNGILGIRFLTAQDSLDELYKNRLHSQALAAELRASSDELTRMARSYVVTGKSEFESRYWEILAIRNGERPRPDGQQVALKELMRLEGFSREEFAKLKEAEDNSNNLVNTELVAMNAVKGLYQDASGFFTKKAAPDSAMARRVMFDEQYHANKRLIMDPIEDFEKMLAERTDGNLRQQLRANRDLALFMEFSIWFSLVVLLVSFIVIRRRVILRILGISKHMEKISAGDFNAVLQSKYEDELGKLIQSLTRLSIALRQKARFVQEIGLGNFEWGYKPSGKDDHMGEALLEMRDGLAKARQEEAKRQEEDRKQNWVTHGLAKFAEILRSDSNDLERLSNTIIAELVGYTSANQGAIFLVNDDDPDNHFLEMMAAYAYQRRKMVNRKVEIFEGLLGSCVLEKEALLLDDVPDGYLKITSGLGEITPGCLLLMPMIVQEKVLGVIEMASFKTFQKHEVEFVRKIGENMAATVAAVRVNLKTQVMLRQTQKKTDQMLARERNLDEKLKSARAELEAARLREKVMQSRIGKLEAQLLRLQEGLI